MKYWFTLLFTLLAFNAGASGYGNTTNIYKTFNTFEGDSGVSDSDLDSVFAGALAASQIQCNTSSSKHQAGAGLGYKSGQNAAAAGYCHSLPSRSSYAHTLGGTAVLMSGNSPAYGVGYNITW